MTGTDLQRTGNAAPPISAPSPSVLLVDDHPENLLALEAILASLGVRLVSARSGEEALLHVLRETFAVILLDVQMPKLDGLQTAELIKNREQTRHIPIIFITALSRDVTHVLQAYGHGAVDYLLKPIDPEILRAKVRVFCDLFVRGEQIRRQALESEMKDVFFAAVARELRTPLAAAKAQVELAAHQLRQRSAHNRAARALEIVTQQIDHLKRIVGDLLDVDRLEAGLLELHSFWFDLSQLLEETRARMQPLSERHPIRVRAPAHLAVAADRDRIEQVLTILLSNAIQYSPDGGPIEMIAEQDGNKVHVSVTDRGVGVPSECHKLIFERFGRAHGPWPQGLGLGLTICKGIVERHGGRTWVDSTGKPGDGSTFHVELPVEPAALPPDPDSGRAFSSGLNQSAPDGVAHQARRLVDVQLPHQPRSV
jgi:signal transduction histidine kinase